MHFKLLISLLFLIINFFNSSVLAKKMHGIAMHGQPKYAEDFIHLDYVNPEAPKGGTIKFGSYGSFDNLNRVAFKLLGKDKAILAVTEDLINFLRFK